MNNGGGNGGGSFKVKHGSYSAEVTNVHEAGAGEVGDVVGEREMRIESNTKITDRASPGLPHTIGLYPPVLETLQKRAIRIICNASYRTHTKPLFKYLNILPFECINKLQIGIFMYKLHSNLILASFG